MFLAGDGAPLGQDAGGLDEDDIDTERAQFDPQAVGEPFDRELRRVVPAAERLIDLPPDGRDVDDAAAIAATLSEHRRFCDLLVACQTVLEHNVPVETARAFKAASLLRLNRLARLVRSRIPGLGEVQGFEFAGLVWVTVAGAWPMAHPAPVMAAVLAEPQFAPLRVDFPFVARQILTVALDGLRARADPGCSSRHRPGQP